MRIIEFRGKLIDSDDTWVGGFYSNKCSRHFITNIQGEHEVNPDTVGQYIDVDDSKDRPMYEGDIVMCWEDEKDIDLEPDGIYEIGYCGEDDDPSFTLLDYDGLSECNPITHYKLIGYIKVVGNIHDNKKVKYGYDGIE